MILPSKLKKGDQVLIIAPARKVDISSLEAAEKLLLDWGLIPIRAKNLLSENGSDFAKNIEHELLGKSPTSLKITFKQINEATEMSLRDALIMEYRMVQRCQASGDFYEGVRAMLVDKDRKPNWKPSDINKVDEIWVNHFFEPLHEKDLKI